MTWGDAIKRRRGATEIDLSALIPAADVRPARAARADPDLHAAAQSFEAAFLAEMLQYTGLNAMPAGFGGGAGEQAFSSLLTEQYARLLAERGGVGLSERIFEILQQRTRSA